MRADSRTKSRVGIIVFAALILFAGTILVIGGKSGFFLARARYHARFPNSQGLVNGNQVRLAGVTVGAVTDVDVPAAPGENLRVRFDIERRYQNLVRTDSRVEIKTIGLLGDKYLEVSVGSPKNPVLPPGEEIQAAQPGGLDKILEGGGDLVEDVSAAAKSLRSILGRTEKGEGLLGEMVSPSAAGQELSRSLRQTLDSAGNLMRSIDRGDGLLGRLVHDKGLADEVSHELKGAVASLGRILGSVEKGTSSGEGIVPALLSDPEGKKKFFEMVDSLKTTADGLASFSKELSGGSGLLPRFVKDDAFAKEFLGDLKGISGRLASIAKKLDDGDGTAGKLVNDTAVYDAMNDILVGIDESKLLRWLIRNRQRSGIQKRYDAEQAKAKAPPTAPMATPAAAPSGR